MAIIDTKTRPHAITLDPHCLHGDAYVRAIAFNSLRPQNCSQLGSSIHGISQATVLGWAAICSFRESSQPRCRTHVPCVSDIGSGFFTTAPPTQSHTQGYSYVKT